MGSAEWSDRGCMKTIAKPSNGAYLAILQSLS
jgi:hypothetical protein